MRALPRPERWRDYDFPHSPFRGGGDVWTAWELSWLNARGLPRVAMAELHFPSDAPRLIESKSLKLYLFSLNQQRFADQNALFRILEQDLGERVGAPVRVSGYDGERRAAVGKNLDEQDIDAKVYDYSPSLLAVHAERPATQEQLYSHLLRSNCPITGQPDWASVHIAYQGVPFDHAALLRYIVSFRNHSGFAEHCTETIFLDILQRCAPQRLRVCCRYLRRGGLDINPWRSTEPGQPEPLCQPRQ